MKEVKAAVQLDVDPVKVFDAFVKYQMLHDWWNVQKTLVEEKKGGIYTLTWNNTDIGFGYVFSGTIDQYKPGDLLVINNIVYLSPGRPILGPMKLSVMIERNENHSLLAVCQSGYQDGEHWDWYYKAVTSAWPLVLQTLKQFLEKEKTTR